MRIYVTAKPKSKRPRVEAVDATHFVVAVAEPPTEGKATRAVLRALAEHFGVSQTRVMLVSGAGSREKVIDID